MRTLLRWLLLAAVAGFPTVLPAQKALIYVGTYTGRESKGIYAWRFDPASGRLDSLGLAAEVANPAFLAIEPGRRFLYAVSELEKGAVTAFAIEPQTGKLKLLNAVATRGHGPCYISADRSGRYVFAANYGSGSVEVFRIQSDGSLAAETAFVQHTGSSVNPSRQSEPHAHSINPSPDNRFAIAADLGMDKLVVYRFDPAAGSLAPNGPPFAKVKPGAGPRHFDFHPSGRFAYVVDELDSTVTAFTWDTGLGILNQIGTVSTLPKDFTAQNSGADLHVHPNGKFVYSSNRGHDSIAVFAVDSSRGSLTPVEDTSTRGKTPRNFGIDPSGGYLFAANQNSNSIVIFRINLQTGGLTATGKSIEVGSPVCVKFVALE